MAEPKRRILMLLSNPYRPDSRVYNEAMVLLKEGYSVALIAWDRDGNWPEKETRDGLEIIRLGPAAQGKSRFVRNVRRFWKNAEDAACGLRFDSIHAHDFDTLPLAVRLKKKHKVPLVFDAHEIYSQMIRVDVSAPISRLVQAYEDICLRNTDRVITVIEGHVDFYKRRVGERVTLFMNLKPPGDFLESQRDDIRKELGLEGSLSFVFIGSLEERKFIHELIEASKKLEGVKILIGGYGKYSKLVEESSNGNPNLVFLGHVHPGKVVPYTSAADIVLSVYFPRQPMAVATKFFDAVSAGTPILVNEDGDRTTELVKKHRCGLAIPYDVNAFIRLARELKKDRARLLEMKGCIIALRREYTWDAMAQRLLNLYDGLWRQ